MQNFSKKGRGIKILIVLLLLILSSLGAVVLSLQSSLDRALLKGKTLLIDSMESTSKEGLSAVDDYYRGVPIFQITIEQQK